MENLEKGKPTQKQFDTFSQKRKARLSKKYPGFYKISADTPTKEELSKYKEGGLKKSTASEFLSPPSVTNIDN